VNARLLRSGRAKSRAQRQRLFGGWGERLYASIIDLSAASTWNQNGGITQCLSCMIWQCVDLRIEAIVDHSVTSADLTAALIEGAEHTPLRATKIYKCSPAHPLKCGPSIAGSGGYSDIEYIEAS
jgi:hypothetical protein